MRAFTLIAAAAVGFAMTNAASAQYIGNYYPASSGLTLQTKNFGLQLSNGPVYAPVYPAPAVAVPVYRPMPVVPQYYRPDYRTGYQPGYRPAHHNSNYRPYSAPVRHYQAPSHGYGQSHGHSHGHR